MEMFTLKRSTSAWLVCCRACGHEQPLPKTATGDEDNTGINVSCERCPSEEAYFAIPETDMRTSTDTHIA